MTFLGALVVAIFPPDRIFIGYYLLAFLVGCVAVWWGLLAQLGLKRRACKKHYQPLTKALGE